MYFSKYRAHRSLSIIVALIALSPFTMEVYLPAMQIIALELNSSAVQVGYTITFYLIGSAIGETFGGSISDQIGRKKNVIFGLSLFIFASLGIALAQSVTAIQILRFIQALGCGFAVVVGLPTLRDLYDPATTAKKMPLVAATTMIAPMIAPVIGVFLMHWNWRSIFLFIALYALIITALFVIYVPAGTGNKAQFSFIELGKQYKNVITYRLQEQPVALYYLLLQGALAGSFLTFLTNASWIYQGHYNVALAALPLFFLIHTGTTFTSNIIISRLLRFFDTRSIMHIGSFFHIGSLFILFALALCDTLSLLVFSLLLFPLMLGSNMLNTSVRTMLLAYFEKLTGSAASLLSLSRYSFGAMGGVLSGIFFNNSMLPVLGIMFFSSVCAFFLVNLLIPKTTLHEITKLERPQGY